MRWTITRVLPEPGPARMSSGPSTVETASRWFAFRPARKRSVAAVSVVAIARSLESRAIDRSGTRDSDRAPEEAEFVALGVGQNEPRLLALADVDVARAQVEQALELLLLGRSVG